ncbi:MAG TPA: G1 family glutamic endopeptidase [Streptosporangiaceae bacterium]
MIPRWCATLAGAGLVFGSLMAVTGAGAAHAATTAHPGVTHIRPGGVVNGFVPGGVMSHPAGAAAQEHGRRNGDESSNWSGYAVTGSDGAFNSVSSSWTEPTATCNDSGTEYAAFWVGLDGFNSDSVEQTGTDSDCDGGSPDYYGWYEMYPAAPVYFDNAVSPGDSMSASVSVSGDTYTITLTDNSQGWTQTENETESGLADSSAEVITEAPSDSDGPLPLADFGTVNYSGSTVNGSSMGGQSPTSITMVGSSGDQLDSTSGMDGSGDFSNTWMAES